MSINKHINRKSLYWSDVSVCNIDGLSPVMILPGLDIPVLGQDLSTDRNHNIMTCTLHDMV